MPDYKIKSSIHVEILVKKTDNDSDNVYIPHKTLPELGGEAIWDTDVLNTSWSDELYYSSSTTFDTIQSDLIAGSTYVSGRTIDADNDRVKFIFVRHLGVNENDTKIDYPGSILGIVADAGGLIAEELFRVDTGECWWAKFKENEGPQIVDIHGDVSTGTVKAEVFALCDNVGGY